MPEKIAQFARSIMHDPEEVRIAVSKPAEKIDQCVYICRDADKPAIILDIFRRTPPERVIVFGSSKQKVKELNIALQRKGFNAAAVHSDLDQKERERVMLDFKSRRIDVLVQLHRHCSPRHRYRRYYPRDQLRCPPRCRRLRAPHRAHSPRRARGARRDPRGRPRPPRTEASIERLLEERIPRADLPEGLSAPTPRTAHKSEGGKQPRGEAGKRGGGTHRGRGKGQQRDAAHTGERTGRGATGRKHRGGSRRRPASEGGSPAAE